MPAMQGTDVVRMLLTGSFALVEERIDVLTDDEWSERALPGTSLPGFVVWHCARILDWTVRCAIQGEPEVADTARWRERFPREWCYGAGIPDALADEIAASTTRAEVREYLADVRASVLTWFNAQTDLTLDAVPPLKANQVNRDGYLERSVWSEVEDLDGLKAWQLLARPCISHVRRHAGELDVLVGLLRARTRSR